MKLPEETLMAYADGELDADTRNAVEAAMATDPQVAAEIARHRALRAKLNAAFDGAIHEPVPDRLIAAARTAPAGPGAQVSDIGAARDARKPLPQRKWSWLEWGAIAASLLVGVIVSRVALDAGSADSIIAKNDGMVAGGALASALNSQPGGTAGSKVQIVASFRAKSGEYCRAFAIDALAGMACRGSDDWRVRALAQRESAAAGDYRMAATALPAPIAQAVAATMAGEALDADEEAAARARDWKQ